MSTERKFTWQERENTCIAGVGGVDRTVSIDIDALTPEIKAQLMRYGLRTRLARATARRTGEEAFAQLEKVARALREGRWQVRPAAADRRREAEREAIFTTLARVPQQAREAVARAIIQDGAPVTLDELRERGIL